MGGSTVTEPKTCVLVPEEPALPPLPFEEPLPPQAEKAAAARAARRRKAGWVRMLSMLRSGSAAASAARLVTAERAASYRRRIADPQARLAFAHDARPA